MNNARFSRSDHFRTVVETGFQNGFRPNGAINQADALARAERGKAKGKREMGRSADSSANSSDDLIRPTTFKRDFVAKGEGFETFHPMLAAIGQREQAGLISTPSLAARSLDDANHCHVLRPLKSRLL